MPIRRYRVLMIGWAALCASSWHARECRGQDTTAAACADTIITGEVARGEHFVAVFADSLQFALTPSIGPPNPDGWTMRVTGSDATHDFLLVATPPFRFSNPRYLDTSYGHSAAQVVAWTPRTFRFVLNEADYSATFDAIGVLLWPAGQSPEKIEEAETTFDAMRTAAGTFSIVSAVLSDPTDELQLGRIEALSFEVELCRADD